MGSEADYESEWSETQEDVLLNLALTKLKSTINDLVEVEKMLSELDREEYNVGELAEKTNNVQKYLENIAEKTGVSIDTWREY